MVLVKKFIFITVCLLIFIVITLTIDLFRTITGINEVNNELESISRQNENLVTLVQENQQNTKETISGFSLHLNEKITELSKDAEKRNRKFDIAFFDLRKSSRMEIDEVKSLITFYIEEVKNKKTAENLLFLNTLVESDIQIQQLLNEGSVKYRDEDFTAAVKVYRKILDIDPFNVEAICYFNASLYYQNPGDESNFSGIKNDLILLLKENVLTKDEELTVLNVLVGIKREEGNADSLIQYQDFLQKLAEDRK